SFIPKVNLEAGNFGEPGSKCAGFGSFYSLSPVRMSRQTDDDADNLLARCDIAKILGIGQRIFALKCFNRRRNDSICITDCETNSPFAEINAEQSAARIHRYRSRPDLPSCSTSRLTAASSRRSATKSTSPS